MSFRSTSWVVAGIALVAVATVLALFSPRLSPSLNDSEPTEAVIPLGTTTFGGSFEMLNHKGDTVTEKNFLGNHTIYYFGYTFCPDICPTSLSVATEAMMQLGPMADRLNLVFVTVDPERDGVTELADYVGHFHPRLVGLTGSLEQTAAMAKTFKVYYQKNKTPGMAEYIVDHTAYLYLVDPENKPLKMIRHTATTEQVVKELRLVLNESRE